VRRGDDTGREAGGAPAFQFFFLSVTSQTVECVNAFHPAPSCSITALILALEISFNSSVER